jgi:hypothetical protein
VTFRPRRGGVPRDVTDQEIAVTPDDRIFLAHDITTPDDVAAAWQEHFARLELGPLFQQFGKSRYLPAAPMKDATAIADFTGHLVQALALRRRADKLGYTRGAIGDGSVFYRYHKHFPSLGLTATLEMSGSTFPETDRTVALRDMSFERQAAEPDEETGALALADVPAVLLCECWNDLRLMATDGTGFAASWRQTSPL